MNLVDWLLIVLAIVVGYTGWRHGFVVGLISAAGFVLGSILGLFLVPLALGGLTPKLGVTILATFLVIGVAWIGQGVLVWGGAKIRAKISSRPPRWWDSLSGVIASVIGLIFAACSVGLVVSSAAVPQVSASVRDSTLLEAVDGVTPRSWESISAPFRGVTAGGVPHVVAPWISEPIDDVEPARHVVRRPKSFTTTANSVVRVIGESSCGVIAGSGFPLAKDRIVTTANVVAGVTKPVVTTGDGTTLAARVVLFEPERDVAVLRVPKLKDRVVKLTKTSPGAGAALAVAGFGDYERLRVESVRVRGTVGMPGRDIYNEKLAQRTLTSLYGGAHAGNTGAPLITKKGSVAGMLLTTSSVDPDTSYALRVSVLHDVRQTAKKAHDPVPTGRCV